MKKTLILLALAIGISITSFAQNPTTGKVTIKSGTPETPAVSTISKKEVKSVSAKIVSSLNSALKLNEKQRSKVGSAVSGFLKKKAKIAELAKTDHAQYATKVSALSDALSTKLKGILTADQYSKYLGLKNSTASGSVLSKLFE